MGTSEVDKSPEVKEVKEPKTPASQEQASAASGAVVADWSGFQGYSPMPPHGYLASTPQAHPYMWGVQQFIPPYGTPPHPYVAMYPHGGVYAHPTMAPGSYPFSPFPMPSPNGIVEPSTNDPVKMEMSGKSTEGKEKLPIKRSRGSLGNLNMITGKKNEPDKTSNASPDGMYSKSAESASEGSCEGSDAHSQNELQAKSSDRPDSAEPSQNGSSSHNCQNGGLDPPHLVVNQIVNMVPRPAAGAVTDVPSPTTNLNIGMDYWGASPAPSSSIPAAHGKVSASATPVTGGYIATGSGEIVQSHLSLQDERELKRQRRKQSNRESARRSRLRKQAECDELAQRAEVLKEENASLRAEVAHIRIEYEQLLSQNASLKERLGEEDSTGEDDQRCSQDDHQRSGDDARYSEQAADMQ